ncbi:DUF6933 domain-containing protein [Psychromonas sp. Urea-02u-13]|uniref:DUF6933 domain-containing protein n=1 Tax=Psychromonas sp. Urea-02u-13 TaxID=2058326 RepID=UPI0018E2A650|nr:hypothetical protein [Psychromonas sp. Urea-02u-13]
MLVFNCTKAAADFFTVTRKGEKISCLEPAPHKTIAESVATPVFPNDVEAQENGSFQWQWVVHCVSIKRKKYLMVMDVHSRFCITLLAGKKGDQYAFLNAFESILKSTFHCLAHENGIDEAEIEICLDSYDSKVNTCAFHARSDRSVQGHLNDVHWHLERHCYEDGMLLDELDLLNFNLFTGQIPRNAKNRKALFFPYREFMRFWQAQIQGDNSAVHNSVHVIENEKLSNIVVLSDYRK